MRIDDRAARPGASRMMAGLDAPFAVALAVAGGDGAA